MKQLWVLFVFIVFSTHSFAADNSIKITLNELLNNGKYRQLNQELANYQKFYQNSFKSEENLITAYLTFESSNTDHQNKIDSWINATPNTYQPYIAKAYQYFSMAWDVRGKRWASETSKGKMINMRKLLTKSLDNLKKSEELFKGSIAINYMKIKISNTLGNNNELQILNNGLKKYPGSYKLRERYLDSITPRWGGSFKQMQSFIEGTKKLLKQYPYLKSLQGLPFMEAAKIQYRDGVYTGAIRLYDKALTFGDNHKAYFKRGRAYYKQENYLKALEDMTKAIKLYPEDSDYYYYRAFVYQQLDDQAKDIIDTKKALSFNPSDKSTIKHRNYIVKNLNTTAKNLVKKGKAKKAISIYESSIDLDSNSARTYSLLASAYIKLNQYDNAILQTKKAIELDKGEFYYYNLLDWILTRKKDWNQIIVYWDKYLTFHPEDDEALVQQSGAYYHNGNIKMALIKAKKAADLGNIQGKEIYNKYKHLLN